MEQLLTNPIVVNLLFGGGILSVGGIVYALSNTDGNGVPKNRVMGSVSIFGFAVCMSGYYMSQAAQVGHRALADTSAGISTNTWIIVMCMLASLAILRFGQSNTREREQQAMNRNRQKRQQRKIAKQDARFRMQHNMQRQRARY